MELLKKYILANREKFEEEPGKGHQARFEKRLKEVNGGGKKIYLAKQLLKVAAVTLLIVLSSLWTLEKIIKNKQTESYAINNLPPEIKEARAYYVSEVNKKYDQISHSSLFHDSIQKELVLQELTDMDSVSKSLQNDLQTSADDERVVNALIEHYRLKLDIMNQILNNLEDIKTNHKQTDHEKSKI